MRAQGMQHRKDFDDSLSDVCVCSCVRFQGMQHRDDFDNSFSNCVLEEAAQALESVLQGVLNTRVGC